MKRICQIVLAGSMVAGTAGAGTEEWTSISPAGPASDIGGTVIALGYADTGEAYLLSALGRLYKRTSIDQPWMRLPITVDGSAVRLTALSIGPGGPATLLGQVGLDRLVRSVDNGTTWTELTLQTTGTGSDGWIFSLSIAPSDADLIYYMARSAAWRSTDGGQTWEQRSSAAPLHSRDLEVHPLSASTLYLLSGGDFFTSVDGGQTWTSSNSGIDPGRNLSAIGIDPTTTQTVYTGGWRETYKSTDAATNWSLTAIGSSSEGVEDIAVDPGNALKVYAVAENTVSGGIYYSTTGADGFWNGRVSAADGWGAFYHVDVSTAGEVLVGGTSGAMTSSDGIDFSATNAGFNDFYTTYLAVAASDENVLYAAGVWGGVMASFDGGQSWSLRNDGIEPGNGRQIAVDPSDAMHVFYCDVNELYESSDGGQNWQALNLDIPGAGIIESVTIAPGDPTRLYIRNNFGLLTSGDGGQNWAEVLDESFFFGGGPNYPVAVSYDEPATVYVGTFDFGLLRSNDAGANWISLNDGLPNLSVNTIALDRRNPQRIVLGLDDNVIVESIDAGASWTDISTNLPTSVFAPHAVAIDQFTGEVHALTALPDGVYKRSADDGQWSRVGDVVFEFSTGAMQLLSSEQTRGRLYLQAESLFAFDFDSDADGIADGTDNCIDAANADQRDTDDDYFGNLCDPDVAPAINDCRVNFLDLNVMKGNFFATGDLDTDLNGDNQTNFADLTIMKDYFFGSPGPSGTAACGAER